MQEGTHLFVGSLKSEWKKAEKIKNNRHFEKHQIQHFKRKKCDEKDLNLKFSVWQHNHLAINQLNESVNIL